MNKKLLAVAVAGAFALPLAASADSPNVTVYGWINENIEFINIKDGTPTSYIPTSLGSMGGFAGGSGEVLSTNERNFSRFGGNASTIGFRGTEDVGNGMKVNFQCESIMLVDGNFSQGGLFDSGFCGRNSKLGLAGSWGEVMYANWLTPYNELFAGYYDPFWDADIGTGLTLLGGFGFQSDYINYYIPGAEGSNADAFTYNRRQNGILQYWSPNWNGFYFRAGWTPMDRQEAFADSGGDSFDPYILSLAANYERGNWGVSAGWEEHNDWSADVLRRRGTAASFGSSSGSDDEAWRAAGWYTFSFGNGSSLKLAAVYEDLEYNFDGTLGTLIPFESLDKDAIGVSFNYMTGPWSFMGHYQDADEISCDSNPTNATACIEDDTDADSFTLGVAYDLSKRTRFWLTYGQIDNEDQAAYDFAISGAGTPAGGEAENWVLRVQHAW